MGCCRSLVGCCLLGMLLASPRGVLAQGYAPAEAAGKMTMAAGLEVQLFASEPMISQPVAMEFDDAGRLWVVQYLQYPNPAGLGRKTVDRYSRTTYDKIPPPPPHGPKGGDRLTILEDTDGDGRADRAHDFLSDLNLASGLAFGHGGVFVLQVPYLLFYADRNRDDKPDGDPDVLLSGFGMEDAHSVANSLTWGPDGWLYGCQGSTVTSNIRGIEFQQGVWRYHPLTRQFELFCEGGGNTWGLDFDPHGNLFYSTNFGGYAMLHGVQGAYYWKQFGKHGALHNPHAYGYFDHVPHQGLHGGHVTVGGIIYQGDSFPVAFRGKYVAADLLGHAMYWHDLEPRGSTFSARHAGDLLLANDTWFAPSDVTMGPDGSVYVCDWHDQRTAHPDPDAQWDRTNGRVYRIRAKEAAAKPIPDLTHRTSRELVALLGERNDWLVRKARCLLADRRDPEVIFPLRTLVLTSADDHLALEALWALYVSGGFSDAFALQSLAHKSADVRAWSVRFLGDERRASSEVAARLVQLAREESSVAVRLQLACTAKRLPPAQALPIIEQLTAHSEDRDDPYIPLLLWWAVQQHSVSAREAVLALVMRPEVRQLPLVRGTILERLVRRYAAEGSLAGYRACVRLLRTADDERPRLLAALDAGLADRGADSGTGGALFAQQAASGKPALTKRLRSANDFPYELIHEVQRGWLANRQDMSAVRLMVRLGQTLGHRQAAQMAADSAVPLETRVAAVQVLGEAGSPLSVDALIALLPTATDARLRQATLRALGQCDHPRIAPLLLSLLPEADAPTRTILCDALLSRPSSARSLLRAIDEKKIATDAVGVDQLRVVALHGDEQLDALVKKHWGSIQAGTPEERLADMRRINNDLRASSGNPTTGKALFTKHCGNCHRLFGQGEQIGPELTHANRKNTDELLAAIVNPSAIIRKEYMNFLVHASDGRVLTGLLVEQTPSGITLLTAKNERISLARDQIETIDPAAVSLMPENLLTPLEPQELRDLFSYLQSDPPQAARSTP